jgi:hypothetical protein
LLSAVFFYEATESVVAMAVFASTQPEPLVSEMMIGITEAEITVFLDEREELSSNELDVGLAQEGLDREGTHRRSFLQKEIARGTISILYT